MTHIRKFPRLFPCAALVLAATGLSGLVPSLCAESKSSTEPAPRSESQAAEVEQAVYDQPGPALENIDQLLDDIESKLDTIEASSPQQASELDGVILFIADGLSYELLTGARLYQGGSKARLHVESLPHTAVVRVPSNSQAVTDSAAAATAISRGYPTDNQMVGQRPDGSSGPSLLDVARKAGWSTGLVTDDAIMGGTVASFIVETPNRFDYARIGSKILDQLGPDKRVDLLIGGGAAVYDLKYLEEFPEQQRGQVEQNATALKQLENVTVFEDWNAFQAEGQKAETALALVRPSKLSYYGEGKRELRLAEMAVAALEWLQQKDRPFLLVVEAALPDKAAHQNQAKLAFIEALEFDRALKQLMQKSSLETLVVATTDHGTGGFTVNYYLPATIQGDALLGKEPLNHRSIIGWVTGPGGPKPAEKEANENTTLGPEDPEYRQPAAMFMNSASHTAGDVWAAAAGPGSEAVTGWIDNDDLFRIIGRAILVMPGR